MKIFCIGYNKTGTTSLSKLMENNNIRCAPQKPFEYNLESFFYENYKFVPISFDKERRNQFPNQTV